MRTFLPNPPWATKSLADAWPGLQAEADLPAAWMPVFDTPKARGNVITTKLVEYGCGAYGCVYPTRDPDVVLKVTTDETEALFAADLADTLPIDCCTAYEMVANLENITRNGRPVYLLWRESANDVGKIDQIVGDHAEQAIHRQHEAAQRLIRDIGTQSKDWWFSAKLWTDEVEAMRQIPALSFVAEGMLRAYEETKVIFGDVHGGNLGLVERDGEQVWVITDPGNIAIVHEGTPLIYHGPVPVKRATVPQPISNPTTRVPTRKEDLHPSLAERERYHNRAMSDDSIWNQLQLVGYQVDWAYIDDDDPLELRDCNLCAQTMSRPVRMLGPGGGFTVADAAAAVPKDLTLGGRKAFISDVYAELVKAGKDNGMMIGEFKIELFRLHKHQSITLARADLVGAMDPIRVDLSELRADGATFHFVVLE